MSVFIYLWRYKYTYLFIHINWIESHLQRSANQTRQEQEHRQVANQWRLRVQAPGMGQSIMITEEEGEKMWGKRRTGRGRDE